MQIEKIYFMAGMPRSGQGRIPLNNSLQIDPEDGSVSLAP